MSHYVRTRKIGCVWHPLPQLLTVNQANRNAMNRLSMNLQKQVANDLDDVWST